MYVSVTQYDFPKWHPYTVLISRVPGDVVSLVVFVMVLDKAVRADIDKRSNMRWNGIERSDGVGVVIYPKTDSQEVHETGGFFRPDVFSYDRVVRG